MDATARAAIAASYFPVHIDSIDNRALDMDLYIRYGSSEPTLYRAIGIEFNEAERTRLLEQGVQFLYVPMSQHGIYRTSLNRRLEGLFQSPDRSKAERGRLVRAACARMVEDVLEFPGTPGVVGCVQEVGVVLGRFMRENEIDFSYILDMSEHDYYTATHMVNVGVGCGMLAAALRPGESEMVDLVIQGGLLHDIGKRGVAAEILNKETDLTPAEWMQMRRHPTLGYEELKQRDNIHSIVLEMTRNHHERLDGSGYPRRIAGSELGLVSRICAIVDVYDALTAARPYRGPNPPHSVLRSMSEGAGVLFDEHAFCAWKELIERLLHDDPTRHRQGTEGFVQRAVFAVPCDLPSPPFAPDHPASGRIRAASLAELPERGDFLMTADRRLYPRTQCGVLITAWFDRQMKEYPVANGEPFNVRLCNVSRAGVQIQTPWPLSINDLLVLDLPGAQDRNRRHIRIVRVRQDAQNLWVAGACFIASEKPEHDEIA